MKTIKEWVDTLPEDIRERAYRHTEKDRLENLEPTLFQAIVGAFLWFGTIEEDVFWHLVSHGKFDEARQLLTNNTTKS